MDDSRYAPRPNSLAVACHEVRAPMASLVASIEALNAMSADDPRAVALRAAIGRNARRALELFDATLDESSPDAPTSPCAVLDELNDAVDAMQGLAEEKSLVLVLRVLGAVPNHVAIDATSFRRVVLNLLSNAIKYTQQGEVQLVVSWSADILTVEVQDTGVGMSASELSEVFAPWARTYAAAATPGVGLGLSLSRELVSASHGELTAESRVGHGSCFRVVLPAASCVIEECADSITRIDSPTNALEGKRILCAEDCSDMRTLLGVCLRSAGAQLHFAEDGEALLDWLSFSRLQLDCLLVDVEMPRLGGLEAVKQLREAGLRVPVIALSAHPRERVELDALAAGCSCCLTKPVPAAQLIATIARVCSSRRSTLASS
jgi:CheY-like chemotaxis protein